MKLLEFVLLVSCLIMCGIVPAAPKIDTVSGYYMVSIGGAYTGQNFTKQDTAKDAATNLSFECCGCEVSVHQPTIRITTTWNCDIPDNTGEATLSWDTPTTRENGDPLLLSEIKHYTVTYWQDGDKSETFTVKKELTEITVHGLQLGTWYFKINTIDIESLASVWSKIVEKTI